MKKIFKYIIRILLSFFAGILLLLAIALIAIQTAPVKKQILRIAEEQANAALNAEVSIGGLSGNFFNDLRLTDILLKSKEQDTLLYVSSLNAEYKLMPLLRGDIIINDISIENPYVYLEELPDSSWNIMHILKESEEKKDTTSSEFSMKVLLEHFSLSDGKIQIRASNEIIPQQIHDLNIRFAGSYAAKEQKLQVSEFRFIAEKPDLEVKDLTFDIAADSSKLQLDKFLLQTALNELKADALYHFSSEEESKLSLQTTAIELSEFSPFLPKDFKPQVKPSVNIDAQLQNKHLALDASMASADQSVNLSLLSDYLIEYFTDSIPTLSPTYDLSLDFRQMDVRDWTGDKELNYLVNGKLKAQGEGFEPNKMKAKAEASFNNMIIYGKAVEKLEVALNYLAGNIKGNIDGLGTFGRLRAEADAKQITGKRPAYQANIETSDFNLAALSGDESHKTNLNLKAFVDGMGFDFKQIKAKSKILLSNSEAMGFAIDSIRSEIDIDRENFIIHSFQAQTLSTDIKAKGNYNMRGNSDLHLNAKLKNMDEIAQAFVEMDSISTSFDLEAQISGIPDSLYVDALLGVGNTAYKETAKLDSLYAQAKGYIKGKAMYFDAAAQAYELSASGFTIDSIDLKAQSDLTNYALELKANNKDIKTSLNGNINIGEAIDILLSDLQFAYKDYQWKLNRDSTQININGSDDYTVSNFELASQSGDSLQIISANGKFSMSGEEDFKLDLRNINLTKLSEIFMPEQKMAGQLSMQAQLRGRAESPTLEAGVNMDGATFMDYKFHQLSGNLNYNDLLLHANINVLPQDSGILTAKAKMPFEMRLDSMIFKLAPDGQDSISLNLLIEKLPLAIAKAFVAVDDAKGYINSVIDVKGTMNKPDMSGHINLDKGKLSIKKYGIDYRDMQANIALENDYLKVDTFLIKSRDGLMKADGKVKFESAFYEGKLNTSELDVLFDRFNPISHRQYNMEMSGNLKLNANKDSTLFSGNIEIPKSEVYIPAVMNLMGRSTAPELPLPLLAIEQAKNEVKQDSVEYTLKADSLKSTSNLAFLNNIQGKVKLKVPRNMWIKNDDMRFELSGDVELLKHKDFFEIFGDVNIVRGQYNLMGRVFVIKSGTITFMGGEDMNPELNIEALYTFRDSERNKRELGLTITDKAFKPKLNFTYEGSSISEGDALSYIVFGTSMDALASGQQESLNSGEGMSAVDMAKAAAASMLSSQLTKLMGNTLNVDYIELKSNSSFDNASVVVGKYITNNLFVSYEQNIGSMKGEDGARYEVKMEYELFKFLFLQLSSSSLNNGFDVIFKFDENTFKKEE